MTIITARLALAVVAMALAAAGTTAPDEELAARTFANAEQLMREGKAEQALRDFDQVVTAYPDSTVADDALFRAGSFYYPAVDVSGLGSAGAEAISRARDLFSRIGAKYSRSNSAPGALLKLGLIALDPKNPKRNLDEAYAAFQSVVNIYPDSAEVERALFGAGYADLMAGKYDTSIGSFARISEDHDRDEIAEQARYQTGIAYLRLGAHVKALESFQAVRTLHPAGRLGGKALDRLTQIYKMKVQPGATGPPLFAFDTTYAPALDAEAQRGAASMAVDVDGGLHFLDVRTGALFRLGPDGKRQPAGSPVPGATALWVDATGAEVLAAPGRVIAGVEQLVPFGAEGAPPRPVEQIAAAVRVSPGQLAILDGQRNEILGYGSDLSRPRTLFKDPAGKARLVGLAVGAEGDLFSLDRRGRRVIRIRPAGTVEEIALPAEAEGSLGDPIDLAADDIGDLFLLDRRSDSVVVMSIEGHLIDTIVSKPGAPGEFSYPSAIAVGPRGEIYIHDEKRKTILRFL